MANSFLFPAVFLSLVFKTLINVLFIRAFYGITKEGNQKMKRLWSEYQLNSSLKELCSKPVSWLLFPAKIPFLSAYLQLNLFASSLWRDLFIDHMFHNIQLPQIAIRTLLVWYLIWFLSFSICTENRRRGREHWVGISLNEIILLTIIVTLNDAIIKFIIPNYAVSCAGVDEVYTHSKGFLLANKKSRENIWILLRPGRKARTKSFSTYLLFPPTIICIHPRSLFGKCFIKRPQLAIKHLNLAFPA